MVLIKDGLCVINLDEYKSIGSHWIALYVLDYTNLFSPNEYE